MLLNRTTERRLATACPARSNVQPAAVAAFCRENRPVTRSLTPILLLNFPKLKCINIPNIDSLIALRDLESLFAVLGTLTWFTLLLLDGLLHAPCGSVSAKPSVPKGGGAEKQHAVFPRKIGLCCWA